MNVHRLRPSELLWLVNSTPAGEVLTAGRLARHRAAAGKLIGDPRTVDLVRYAAWLFGKWRAAARGSETHALTAHLPLPHGRGADQSGSDQGGADRSGADQGDAAARQQADGDAAQAQQTDTGYAAQRERARLRQLEQSRQSREIGELPAVADAARRARCRLDLAEFCMTYFPHTFYLPWSEDHRKVIRKVERAALEGGLFAVAMPRGAGKTSICEAACLWVLLYVHHRYAAIIGPDETHAYARVRNITAGLETSDLLLADFPEVVYPIRKLEGIYQRRLLYRGLPVRIELTASRIVFPQVMGGCFVAGEASPEGAVVSATGLTGQVRGLNLKTLGGVSLRPDFILIDDPQTRESAHSPSQCALREQMVNGDVLGLAGPGKKMSAVMPCTVIAADDVADRFLDRKRNPSWRGERTKLLYAEPTATALWDEYAKLFRAAGEEDRGTEEATAFYVANRAAMDAGAVVAWPACFMPHQVSAVQYAMDLRIDRPLAFAAEYQNDPPRASAQSDDHLTIEVLLGKLNGHAERIIPLSASTLTLFIDVQQAALYWAAVAWEQDFTGYVVGYGTEPDQRREYFALREIKRTLALLAPKAGVEGAIYAGLERLTTAALGHAWRREDGGAMRVDRCLIDANWGPSTDVVYQFAKQSPHAALMTPSHGTGVTAARMPMIHWAKKPGDRVGLNWRLPALANTRRAVRHVIYDTNFWKTFVHDRLLTAMGDPGCLSLWGRGGERHRLIADHVKAEYYTVTQGRGRTVHEWDAIPGRDNHWWDGLVGCAVAASMCGVSVPSMGGGDRIGPRKKVSWSERQRQRMAGAKRIG